MSTEISKLTPMIRQYLQIKERYRDAILFFRLGDFYEMFFEDAEKASKILDIALTSRNRSDDGAVLSADCNSCHLLIGRVDEPGKAKAAKDRAVLEILKNPHPVDIGTAWKDAPCHSCHGG